MTKDGVTNRYKYNELNQLTSSVENKDGKETSNKTYTYDANGNQTKEKDSVTNITVENTYDVDNRLSTSITVNGTKEVVNQENLYNGNGKRIQKKEGNNVVTYFYQDGVVLYTSDKDGNKTSQNFVGIDGNVIGTTRYSSEGFKYYTYNKDVQGSTTSVVGKDGISPVAYDYDDFGVTTTIGDSNFFNEVCYTGGIYDVSTGLYYLNARYYDPNNGRFITHDTYRGEINNPSTLHLYAYCANNPINYIDPSGHFIVTFGVATGISIVYKRETYYGIAVSSNGTFGMIYSKVNGIDIGTLSVSIGLQVNVYPSNTSINSLAGRSFNAGGTVNFARVSASGGVSIGLEKKNKGVSPSFSGNIGGITKYSTPINIYATHSKTEVLKFPDSINKFLSKSKNTQKKYSFKGSKVTIKNKDKKYIEVSSNKIYGKIYKNKTAYIKKK